jgi:hypothetical protein
VRQTRLLRNKIEVARPMLMGNQIKDQSAKHNRCRRLLRHEPRQAADKHSPIYSGRATLFIHIPNTNTRTQRHNEKDMSYPRRPRGTLPREPKGQPLPSMVEGGFLAGAGGSPFPSTGKPELCGIEGKAGTYPSSPNRHYARHAPVTGNYGPCEALVMGDATFFRGRTGSLPGPCRPRFRPVSRGS